MPTPKAMYLVAVVFFGQALLAALAVVSVSVEFLWNKSPEARAVTVGLTVCAACLGVYLLMREYRVARWLMYALTAYFVVIMLVSPADPTPPLYQSAGTQYRNRALIALPMLASSVYLARRRGSV
jgi:hypothetical protein